MKKKKIYDTIILAQNNSQNILKVQQHRFTPGQDTLAMEYIKKEKMSIYWQERTRVMCHNVRTLELLIKKLGKLMFKRC